MRPRGSAGAGADAGRRKRQVRAPPCTREKQRQRALTRGEHLMPQATPPSHPPPEPYTHEPPTYMHQPTGNSYFYFCYLFIVLTLLKYFRLNISVVTT